MPTSSTQHFHTTVTDTRSKFKLSKVWEHIDEIDMEKNQTVSNHRSTAAMRADLKQGNKRPAPLLLAAISAAKSVKSPPAPLRSDSASRRAP